MRKPRSGGRVVIRPMRAADAADAIKLWAATPGVTTADTPALIRRFLKRNPGCSFVARQDGWIVGTVLGGDDGRRGSLWHLAVVPGLRRRGLGRALTAKALAALRRRGVTKVNILVLDDNEGGIRFWKRLKWETLPTVSFTRWLRQRR